MKNFVVLSKDGRELQTDILVHPGSRLKKELAGCTEISVSSSRPSCDKTTYFFIFYKIEVSV